MKILVACEFSGVVREAFRKRGHDAWSCDLLPSEIAGQHIQDDVMKHLNENWDLMIAHPPCTYLSYAGIAYWNRLGREEKRQEAMRFFMALINAPISKICVENPVGLPSKAYRKPDQIIHPYYFGERQMKRTCLWLKNLPKLFYSKENLLFIKKTAVEKPEPIYCDSTTGHKRYFTDAISGFSVNAGHKRSRFWPVIANAMAEQWG